MAVKKSVTKGKCVTKGMSTVRMWELDYNPIYNLPSDDESWATGFATFAISEFSKIYIALIYVYINIY